MPKSMKIMDSLLNNKTEWRCRIVKFRVDVDGKRFFKLHWRSTKAPVGNKWGVSKISWKDTWEPEEHVSAKCIQIFWKKSNKVL